MRSRTPCLFAALLASTLLGSCSAGTDESARPPLVLLLSVDTLRADRLGAYGSERGLTPNLDALAKQSLLFEAAYAPTAFTAPSIGTIMTGRYPTQNQMWTNQSVLPEGIPTLAMVLREAGYRTGAVVSNWVLRRQLSSFERGFEEYDDVMLQEEQGRRNIPERIAPATTDDALELLDSLRSDAERVFLWVHYQDPHGPYTPPAELHERRLALELAKPEGRRELPFSDDWRGLGGIPMYQRVGDHDELGWYVAGYDAEVLYTDAEIGRLLAGLEERGLMEQALIVFVADHGEGLGENDYWFAHGEHLSDPLVRVPLLLRSPHIAPGRRETVVGLVDLLPTLLAQLALPTPAGVRGRDLLAAAERDRDGSVYMTTLGAATRPRSTLIEGGYKYTRVRKRGTDETRERLVRLDGAGVDLSESEPGRLLEMREAHERFRASLASEYEGAEVELSEQELEQLQKLGYVQGSAPQDPGHEH